MRHSVVAHFGLVVFRKWAAPLFALAVFLFTAMPSRAADLTNPSTAHISGGVMVEFYPISPSADVPVVTFGGVPATDVHLFIIGSSEEGASEWYGVRCRVPAQAKAGAVDVTFIFPGQNPRLYPGAFTYYDAPVLESITPNQHSILPDDVPVTINGVGFPVAGNPPDVYFGTRRATQVAVSADGESLTCLPPPFVPGTPFPLPVDVRVKNPGGAEGLLTGQYEYGRVIPIPLYVLNGYIPAWTIGDAVEIEVEHLVEGPIRIYFDGIPAACGAMWDTSGRNRIIGADPPPHAPGYVDLTIVNGDGGVFVQKNGAYYWGTESTDFHSADLNHDFRMSLSEVLRVAQLFNVGGFHCEVGTEDGYALGAGDETCVPHASDHIPQDWQIELDEVLEVVQFFNLYCYQPCPGTTGTYCPPDEL